MADKTQKRLRPNLNVVFKAMGHDLVAVNEIEGFVVVLNATARTILEGLAQGNTNRWIGDALKKNYEFDRDVDLDQDIDRVRTQLIKARVLLEALPYSPPEVNRRDLASALRDIDLAKAEVSQVE